MNSMYGGMGYGGYGGGYGGYGMNGMYGGMPGMYGGMAGGMGGPGGPFDPNNPSLSQTLESTTQHTFALLHSIVQTFSGVAQMLESTFMATHSSFFAMVGVVEQFGQLRNALGSVLGLFGLVRWMRNLLTGRSSPQGAMRGEFRDFINGRPVQGPQPPAPKASRKPLIIFLLAIFGVPYAMHKLIKILTERQQQQQEAQMVAGHVVGGPLPPLDPSQLTFARALYPFDASSQAELSLKENEIVAIMGKLDPATGAEVDPRIEVRNRSAGFVNLRSHAPRCSVDRSRGANGGRAGHGRVGKAGSRKNGCRCWRGESRSKTWRRRRSSERVSCLFYDGIPSACTVFNPS